MHNMPPEIAPCPKCGMSAGGSDDGHRVFVKCDVCELEGPKYGGGPIPDLLDSFMAVVAWNMQGIERRRRAEEDIESIKTEESDTPPVAGVSWADIETIAVATIACVTEDGEADILRQRLSDHHYDGLLRLLAEARRRLYPGASVAVVDWTTMPDDVECVVPKNGKWWGYPCGGFWLGSYGTYVPAPGRAREIDNLPTPTEADKPHVRPGVPRREKKGDQT